MSEYELEMRKVMKALSEAGALPYCIVTGSEMSLWFVRKGVAIAR